MNRPSLSTELKFTKALRTACAESERIGYNPHEFAAMLDMYGGVRTAEKLVRSGSPQTGLKKLAGLGRLDLALETVMLSDEFAHLFSKSDLDAAEWKLRMVTRVTPPS